MKELPLECTEEIAECEDGLFESKEDMRKSLMRLFFGDFYIIGKIWIEAMKYVLIGKKLRLIPVVHAAKQPPVPERPPPMKYKELPIYKSPHYEYKDYIAQKDRCPEAKIKLLHRYLYPHVRDFRRQAQKSLLDMRCESRKACKEVCSSVAATKRDFKRFMRDPDNLRLRQGVFAAGTVSGYLLGSGGGIPRRVFCTSLGGLLVGALCFPRETDELFRYSMFNTGKFIVAFYNFACKKQYGLKERIPCRDLPTIPPKKQQCPEK